MNLLKNTNGFIGLNPYPFFIDPTFKNREQKIRAIFKEQLNDLADKQETTAGKWIAKQHFLQKTTVAGWQPSFRCFRWV